MNYYPSNASWTSMWTKYDHARTQKDFAKIKSLGATAVRIIVQPSAVGYPSVTPKGRVAFDDILATAASSGLRVQLTLFDWWSGYKDRAGAQKWATDLLSGHAHDSRIAMVELQNEMNPKDPAAMAWARAMLPVLSRLLPGVPRTISTAGGANATAGILALNAAIPKTDLDVIDLHVYGDPAGAVTLLRTAKQIAQGREVIIGEAGLSTGSSGYQAQSRFYSVLGSLASRLGIPPPAPWTLNDFVPGTVPGRPTNGELSFGLERTDGTWKPAATAVKQVFTTNTQAYNGLDLGFEQEAVGQSRGALGSWRVHDGGAARSIRVVAGAGKSNSKAACISGARGNASALPSFAQALPLTGRGTIIASSWVRLGYAGGATRIGLSWFDGTGRYLGQSRSLPAVNTVSGWQHLSVAGTPPVGAVKVQLDLMSGQNVGTACFDDAAFLGA